MPDRDTRKWPVPRAVLFDLDGVLIESYWVWFHLLNHAAKDFGYPAIPDDVYRSSWGQSTTADRDSFFSRHDISEVEAFYDEHYDDHLEHLVVPEAVPGTFEKLRKMNVKSAVVTNTQTSIAQSIVRRAGLDPDRIVGSSDVELPKPAPDMLVRASELLEVPIDSTWMIGDSRYDLEAAKSAGVFFVGLGIEGDLTLRSFGELLTAAREALAFEGS